MTQERFTFTFDQDEQTTIVAIKARVGGVLPKVRGDRWALAFRVLQVVMVSMGSVGVAVALEYLVNGRLGFPLWAFFIGIALFYAVLSGAIYVTIPVMARRAWATRANEGPVTMTLDASGVNTQITRFQSHIAWAGLQAVTRTKLGFVFLIGGSRPSLPFHVFQVAEQIETVDVPVKNWMETSR